VLTLIAPTTQLHELMTMACELRASDLHLVAGRPPSLRIDGKIVRLKQEALSDADLERLVEGILQEPHKAQLKRRRSVELCHDEPGLGRFRISIFHALGRLAGSFRLVPGLQSAEDLGLPWVVNDLARKLDGLVLVTGPVGSGKTTTLNYIIDFINSERCVRILSIEDPVEYVHTSKFSEVLQLDVGEDTPSFSRALRAGFRQDPNVICVGEMRDLKTMSIALRAAETGHLVLSTLHTPTATATVDRIIDSFPPHQHSQVRAQLAGVLRGVICQKLLPRASGTGRVLAYEVMLATQAVRRLIRDGKEDQIPNLLTMGKEGGMVSMDQCLCNLCRARAITYETALAHCLEPDRLKGLEPVDDRQI
jgi:twitching motility protein PilT